MGQLAFLSAGGAMLHAAHTYNNGLSTIGANRSGGPQIKGFHHIMELPKHEQMAGAYEIGGYPNHGISTAGITDLASAAEASKRLHMHAQSNHYSKELLHKI